jgi:hypothetical protein
MSNVFSSGTLNFITGDTGHSATSPIPVIEVTLFQRQCEAEELKISGLSKFFIGQNAGILYLMGTFKKGF